MEQFTDTIINALNQQRNHLVFMLWGSYAQQKGKYIDRQRHLVLTSPTLRPYLPIEDSLAIGIFLKLMSICKSMALRPFLGRCSHLSGAIAIYQVSASLGFHPCRRFGRLLQFETKEKGFEARPKFFFLPKLCQAMPVAKG